MGNGRKTTDNRQLSKDAVNGPVDCLFLWVFISYYVSLRRSTLRLYRFWIELISPENISCIYFIFYIIQTGIVTVGYNGMT